MPDRDQVCPHCMKPLELTGGPPPSGFACPSCGKAIPSGDMVVPAVEADIKHGGMTITQFMAGRGIVGGVALDENKSSTASSVLVDQAGRKYDVGNVVARGGMGAILSAKDLNIRRTVAMKVMLDPKKASDEQILRFIEEAQITGQMEHPSIVPVHELGVDVSGSVFYTMKYVKGASLSGIVQRLSDGDAETVSKYPLNSLLNIFLKACDAVAFAHMKNVVHRDLKPENIMVGEFGEVLVMDWGLGKILGREGKEKDAASPGIKSMVGGMEKPDIGTSGHGAATMDGMIMGTPLFMPPEQAYGKISEIDQQSDIYSLGAILYSILTLHPPVEGECVNEILLKVVQGKIEPPSKYERGQKYPLPHLPGRRIPPPLSSVAMKAMAFDKKDRYRTVKDLQKDIEAWQGGFATSAEDAGLVRQLLLLVKRHKGFVAAVTAVLISVTSGLIISLVQRHQAVVAKVEAQEQRDAAEKAKAVEQSLRETAEYDAYVGRLSIAQRRIDDSSYDQAEAILDECPEKYRHWEWKRLKFLCNVSELKFPGKIDSACFSPEGKLIVTSSSQWNTAAAWDSLTGELIKKLSCAEGRRIILNPSGTVLAVSKENEIRLWDISKDECLHTLSGHAGEISGLAFSKDGKRLLSGGRDGHVMIWNVETGKCALDWTPGPRSVIESVDLSPSGNRFIAGGGCKTMPGKNAWIVNANDGSVACCFSDNSYSCNAVAWSLGGEMVAIGGYAKIIHVFNPATGILVRDFEPSHIGPIFSLRFSNDGKRLLSGSADRTVKTWDVETGKAMNTFSGHSHRISEANWSPDNTRFISATRGGVVRVWRAEQPADPKLIVLDKSTNSCFSRDASMIVSASGLWDARYGRKIKENPFSGNYALSPDGSLAAAGREDGNIAIMDAKTMSTVKTFIGHIGGATSLAFSPDSKLLVASSSKDEATRLWNITDGKELWQVAGVDGAFTPDGDKVVVKAGIKIALISAATGKELWRSIFPCRYICSAPDGKTLLVGRWDAIEALDAATGKALLEFKGHAGSVFSACYSPDGRRVVSGGDDGTVRIWDAKNARELMLIPGDRYKVAKVDWSSDGKSILGVTESKTTFVWPTE